MTTKERTLWFCGCVRDDCNAVVLGPFLDRELAELEGEIGCSNAHLVGTRVGETISVQKPSVYTSSETKMRNLIELKECREWRNEHNNRAYELSKARTRQPEMSGEYAFPETMEASF